MFDPSVLIIFYDAFIILSNIRLDKRHLLRKLAFFLLDVASLID